MSYWKLARKLAISTGLQDIDGPVFEYNSERDRRHCLWCSALFRESRELPFNIFDFLDFGEEIRIKPLLVTM